MIRAKSFFVFDLETIDDPLLPPQEKPVEEGEEPKAKKKTFPAPIHHLVVSAAIGAFEWRDESVTRRQENGDDVTTTTAWIALKKMGIAGRSGPYGRPPEEGRRVDADGYLRARERAILSVFHTLFGQADATMCLVTWNGRGFDLPVLTSRSFHHAIPLPWYYRGQKGADPRYRYSREGAWDLMDDMADLGAVRQSTSLDAAARAMGLRGKAGTTGGSVAAMVAAGEWDALERYNLGDVVMTAMLLFRNLHLRGELTGRGYVLSVLGLLRQLPRDRREGREEAPRDMDMVANESWLFPGPLAQIRKNLEAEPAPVEKQLSLLPEAAQ